MKTAIIYVFSGTDNTLITAKMAAYEFEQNGIKATVHSVKAPFKAFPSPNDFDYAGFAYPVYAFNAPKVFIDFVKSLPDAGIKAFIFKTSGEPYKVNDASSSELYNLLKRKGFDVALDRHLLMPYNIVFRYNDDLVKQMYLYNEKLCSIMVDDLIEGKRDDIRFNLGNRIFSAILKIQQPAGLFNGKLYTVNKKCNMCQKCVRECPTGNISIKNGKLKFAGNCAMCMRCVMFCPMDAINPGLLRPIKVNGAYDFDRILSDDSIEGDYVNENTKGYFKFFRKYYRNANKIIQSSEEDKEPVIHKKRVNER